MDFGTNISPAKIVFILNIGKMMIHLKLDKFYYIGTMN